MPSNLLLQVMWSFRSQPNAFDEALRRYIDSDFSVFAAGRDAPTESDIESFERNIGFLLPQDFRTYSCSPLGGMFIEAKESVWPRAKELAIAPFWSWLYGMFVYALSNQAPDYINIWAQTEQFRRDSNTSYVPCLKVLMHADLYCFDQHGQVRRWNHETGEAPLQNKTFTQIFVQELSELRSRKDRKKAERQAVGGIDPHLA